MNGNLARAQSIDYKAYEVYPAYEILNLLEHLYPKALSPSEQITRVTGKITLLTGESEFYRNYVDSGIQIRTKKGELYVYDFDRDELHNLGSIDVWLPFVQAEILFNWLEAQVPGLLTPSPQPTQAAAKVFYRFYPDKNIVIGTFQKDLYFLDGKGTMHNLGRVSLWLDAIVVPEKVLGGLYTIRQKCTGRYVDAYTDSHDYILVTRPQQYDNTQKWIVTSLGNRVYGIQQKHNYRFIEAYATDKDNRIVTRPAHDVDRQRWIIAPLPGWVDLFTIRQKSDSSYVYGDVSSYWLGTRPREGVDAEWFFAPVYENFYYNGMVYVLDQAVISDTEEETLYSKDLVNPLPLEQSIHFEVNETRDETSRFEYSRGFVFEVGKVFSVGMPYVEEGTGPSIKISGAYNWTSGRTFILPRSYKGTFPVTVAPGGRVRAEAVVKKSTLSVPYIMFFYSSSTGALQASRGTWTGVSRWGLECVVTKE